MPQDAQVVVIGGGIAGLSTLYHLTREGITDALLLERDELTSGTTWHSAAQVTNFGALQVMVGLKSHSIRLYKELADDPDYPITYHHASGGIRFAAHQDHLDGYHHFAGLARGMGVAFEVIDAAECQRRHPLITTQGLAGGLWDPLDGDIDPAQLCQALARRARKAGARINRFSPVTGIRCTGGGEWIVSLEDGAEIRCAILVNAGGYRCNEIAAMMGVTLPVVSMEHQYLLTEPVAEIAGLGFRMPLLRCPLDDFYARQEKNGLLVGFYEQDCRTWGLDGIDPEFSMALCPNDLDRLTDVMAGAFARLPCLNHAGVHTVINGPITYTPDGLPLVGAIAGLPNAYCITGLRAGLGEGGGHGWLLAQIIAHGDACYDTWPLDPRRFTRYADTAYTAQKAVEDYRNEFRFHMPGEHRPAGRPCKTTPLYHRLGELGAEFAAINGWERADYFRPGPDFAETLSFRFTNLFDVIAAEVETVQNAVGIMEVSGFTRYEISGPHVHERLDPVMCGRIPRRPGRVGLAYALTRAGMVKGEATLANLDPVAPDQPRIWYGSAAAAQAHDLDWLHAHLPDDGSITVRDLTDAMTTLVLAGPWSRAVLARALPEADWSAEAFPWLAVRQVSFCGGEAVVMSVSFSGERAYEIHLPNLHLAEAFGRLMDCGAAFGIRPFGLRATESMRLEKGYRHWKADLICEYDPFESGLARFVDMEKDFVGKAALRERQAAGPRRRFVTAVLACDHAPAQAGDSFLAAGQVVGTVTSAGWGHRVGKNLAMGFIDPAHAAVGSDIAIALLGETVPARVCAPCLYDPENRRVRA